MSPILHMQTLGLRLKLGAQTPVAGGEQSYEGRPRCLIPKLKTCSWCSVLCLLHK